MSDGKDMNETMQRLNHLKETLELLCKFITKVFQNFVVIPLKSTRFASFLLFESAIQEAAAFISNRTAVVIHDINEEISREYMKAFYDMIQKGETR